MQCVRSGADGGTWTWTWEGEGSGGAGCADAVLTVMDLSFSRSFCSCHFRAGYRFHKLNGSTKEVVVVGRVLRVVE